MKIAELCSILPVITLGQDATVDLQIVLHYYHYFDTILKKADGQKLNPFNTAKTLIQACTSSTCTDSCEDPHL